MRTTETPDFIDITDRIETVLRRSAISAGKALISFRHTTAGLTINENESLLRKDMTRVFGQFAAPENDYRYNDLTLRSVNMPENEEPNGHAHCQCLLLNTSEFVPALNGQMQLETWQRLFLVKLERPRDRGVLVQISGK